MQGRRTYPESIERGIIDGIPGDYFKDGLDWRGITPNDLQIFLKIHHVEEHADGTISVIPGPWGSNSILASNGIGNKSWHGYIERGIWKEC